MVLDEHWIARWSKTVNEDKVLKVIGKYFTANFLLEIGGKGYFVAVRNGQIEQISTSLPDLFQCHFALKASAETWEKFAEPIPAPIYNDIWAMYRYRFLQIEGDSKVLFQNLRGFSWMLDLMRRVQ